LSLEDTFSSRLKKIKDKDLEGDMKREKKKN